MLCRTFIVFLASLLLSGCASPPSTSTVGSRRFEFSHDAFAYANELVWEYHFDETGKHSVPRKESVPKYTHHCFVVARSARQFFEHASFDPTQPKADEATYRRLIRQVVSISSRRRGSASEKLTIPGYANLHEFSVAQERLLKEECGGAWQSYLQRGHWRMIFPFSRSHQSRIARQLVNTLNQDRPPIVHLVCFPSLAINHAILLFQVLETDRNIEFLAYDPNDPDKPAILTYVRTARSFYYGANSYFRGGRVAVFETYHAWNY